MPTVERRITINAPPQAVWDVLADVTRQPRWMHDLRSVELDDDRPIGVGTRAHGTVRMFGLSQRDPIEIIAFDPPRTYAVRHLGGFSGTGEFALTGIGRGGSATRVRWREQMRPDLAALGIPAIAAPLMRVVDLLAYPVFAVVFRADLRRLRDLVEASVASRDDHPGVASR
jgi:uncharacterized protein YndB with AHSA1/START domain